MHQEMTNGCGLQAAEFFLNCDTTPQILSSETLKTIQELLNNGFVNRMKSLRMQQIDVPNCPKSREESPNLVNGWILRIFYKVLRTVWK